MLVLGERPEAGLAVAAAHGDDRELAVEGDDLLGQLVLAELLVERDAALPLAVVAEPPRLDDAGSPDSASEPNRAVGMPRRWNSCFSTRRSCPSSSASGGGSGGERSDGLDGHVLELVGDDCGAGGELPEGRRIVVGADDELAHLARQAHPAEGSRKRNAQPERETGEGEHPPELAAADAGDERHRTTVDHDVTRRGRARRARTASARRGTLPGAPGCPRPTAPGSPRRAARR